MRRALVAISEVASDAGNLGVLFAQRIRCLVVVKSHVPPRDHIVTRPAIVTQLAFVRLDLLVTRGAIARGFAEFLSGGMTAFARHACVRTLQRKIGRLVIELLAAQFHDIAVAPEVLGMACAALGGRNALYPAVHAVRAADILRNGLMAIQT